MRTFEDQYTDLSPTVRCVSPVWELWEGESHVERCKLPLPGKSWSVPHGAGLRMSQVFETVTSLANSVHISQELLEAEWLKAAQLPKTSQVKKEQRANGWRMEHFGPHQFLPCQAVPCQAVPCHAMLCSDPVGGREPH